MSAKFHSYHKKKYQMECFPQNLEQVFPIFAGVKFLQIVNTRVPFLDTKKALVSNQLINVLRFFFHTIVITPITRGRLLFARIRYLHAEGSRP